MVGLWEDKWIGREEDRDLGIWGFGDLEFGIWNLEFRI
jgi:hypothetical protein